MEENELQSPANNGTDLITFSDDFDSACSTPFVSAPSSPGLDGFFYSAPASPIHFMLSYSSSSNSNTVSSTTTKSKSSEGCVEFEFIAKQPVVLTGSMTCADELFLNGQIRPMKLSSHLQRPHLLSPLLDVDENETYDNDNGRGRDLDRSKSLRRRARSMSPLRTNDDFQWLQGYENNESKSKLEKEAENEEEEKDMTKTDNETTHPGACSSRSSSVGRSSKRWVFLKEFLYRSKSEGRNSTSTSTSSNVKFWTSLSFSSPSSKSSKASTLKGKSSVPPEEGAKTTSRKAVNVVGMTSKQRRVARSAHEVHYTTNRAQAEEMRRKTYLPYKQGLLGCLGFSSKSYGAMNGFARAFNPVSTR